MKYYLHNNAQCNVYYRATMNTRESDQTRTCHCLNSIVHTQTCHFVQEKICITQAEKPVSALKKYVYY